MKTELKKQSIDDITSPKMIRCVALQLSYISMHRTCHLFVLFHPLAISLYSDSVDALYIYAPKNANLFVTSVTAL